MYGFPPGLTAKEEAIICRLLATTDLPFRTIARRMGIGYGRVAQVNQKFQVRVQAKNEK
jgi:hypothetical protein